MSTQAAHSWKPTFIGIGAAKSATTWCWEALRQHPDVDAGQPKEINFFNSNFDRGVGWYARHFSNPQRPVRGEISPLYLEEPVVAQRIAATFPEARLLVVLRDPYARALSNVLHDVRDCRGGVADATEQIVRDFAMGDPKYLRRSLYAECLNPFLERFPTSSFAVLFYEDLKRDARQFLRSLYSSICADPDYVPDRWQSAANRTQDYSWPRLFKVLRLASQAAKAMPPTRAGLEWLYRNTRIRERTLAALSVDRGQPAFEFDRIFGRNACDLIRADIDRLQDQFEMDVPSSWHIATHAALRHDAA